MDFIERLFGISPDGGSGTLELFLLVVSAIALYWIGAAAHKRVTIRSIHNPQSKPDSCIHTGASGFSHSL
jgi:hypothetical protein